MKKRISDLSSEEQQAQRDKWRKEKQDERAEKKRAAYIPTASEWADEFAATEQGKALKAYVNEFSNTVVKELGRQFGGPQKDSAGNVVGWDYDEEFTVGTVGATLLGLKRNWSKTVCDPNGEMIAGSFMDDCNFASDLIESAHRHGLKQSTTFATTFHELLGLLNKRYGPHSRDGVDVRAELAGTYVPPQSKPKLNPDPRNPEVG